MPGDAEQVISVRRFKGVDLAQDAAFIGTDALVTSDSFAPNPSFVLAKRQGQSSPAFRQVVSDQPTFAGAGLTIAPLLIRTYDDSGHRYLILVAANPGGALTDTPLTSLDDGAFLVQTAFASSGKVYGAAQLGQILYLGNGTDALKAINLGSPVTSTNDPLGLTAAGNSDGVPGTVGAGGDPTTPPDANALIQPGTYAYAWAIYNVTSKKWTHRYDARSFTDTTASDHNLTFTAPAAALPAGGLYHLFVAGVNRPIELATDQAAGGVAASGTIVLRAVSEDGTAIPSVSATRTGNLLLAHRNRLWLSGDQTAGNASRVYASSVILPGAEQDLFNQQPYFPQNAVLNVGRQDGDRITALGRAALTVTTQSPDAPLLMWKNTQSWAFFGDILGDSTAQLTQLSAEIGCPAPFTVVETPIGTMFMSLESVYLVRPEVLIPFEVGFPIAPSIRQIPAARRAFACAVYHRGFYKLAITPPGGTGNTQQWWLDLRRILGGRSLSSEPSWWGPHTTPAVIAVANARQDPAELDRAMQLQSQGNVGLMDQPNVYTDLVNDQTGTTTTPVVSRVGMSTFDGGAPFGRKRWTRLRTIARADSPAAVSVNVVLDDAASVMPEVLSYSAISANVWDATWDATWGTGTFGEAESLFTADAFRAPHRTASVQLQHGDAAGFAIHDVELRYVPVDRPVA